MPSIQTHVKRLRDADVAVQLQACRQLSNELSQRENAPFGAVISAGAVPLLLQLFERGDAPALQFYALFCIGHMAADDAVHTRAVVDHGAIAALVRLLIASRQVDNSDGLTQEAANCITKAWTDHPIPDRENVRPLNRTVGVHDLREKALWALGNIAGDGAPLRKACLDAGALQGVLQNIMQVHTLHEQYRTV